MCPCRRPKTNPARVRVIMDPVKGVRTPAKVSVYWIKGAAARHRGEREAVPTVEDTREREASQPLEAVVLFDGGDPGPECDSAATGRLDRQVQALPDADSAGGGGGERVHVSATDRREPARTG